MKGLFFVIAAAVMSLAAAPAAAQIHHEHHALPTMSEGEAPLHHGLTGQQMLQNIDRLLEDCETRVQELASIPKIGQADKDVVASLQSILGDMQQLRGLLQEHLRQSAHEHVTGQACGCASLGRMAAKFDLMVRQIIAARRAAAE